MVKSDTTSITPATHADRHSVGGVDPLVNPLLVHHTRHEGGGDDVITIVTEKNDVVFTGAAPGAWTDLDLSAYIPAGQHLVALGISETVTGAARSAAVRTNGDAVEYYQSNVDYIAGLQCCNFWGTANTAVLLVLTDTNGIIEWKGSPAGAWSIELLWSI